MLVAAMNVDWPPTLTYPFRVVGWLWAAASAEALSADCILWRDSQVLPLAVQRIVFYLSMPLAMLLVLLSVDVLVMYTSAR
jgi:hypothetical protein